MKEAISTFFAGLLAVCFAYGQPSNTPIVNSEYTRENGQKVLLGQSTRSVMQQGIYKAWYDQFYDEYSTEATIVERIKPLLTDDVVIEIFAGSWCGDTRREIPRLLKVLDEANIDTTQLRLIFVDNSKELFKQSPQHEEAGKNILRIPTIIVYKDDKELNRIVETPVNTLEQDLAHILEQKQYVPNYFATAYLHELETINKPLSASELSVIAERIKLYPANARELNGYSYTLSSQDNIQKAINVLEINTLLFPGDPSSYLNLGKVYQEKGEKDLAKAKFEKVLALQPDNEDAKEGLAVLNGKSSS